MAELLFDRMIFQAITYYRRINLAVVMGAAVATAVLTGALLVGDSVRGSLRDLTLDRLGKIDQALVSDRFFRQALASELARDNGPFDNLAPAILLTGSATHSSTKARASGINLLGIDARFVRLFESSSTDSTAHWERHLAKRAGQFFPSIIINATLQKELHAKIGDHILIAFARQSDIPRESLLGSREASDLVETARFTLTRIIPDRGIGRFGLRPHQNLPLNAYVSLGDLQEALDKRDHINALLLSRQENSLVAATEEKWQNLLRKHIQLEDLGILLRPDGQYLSVESREIILDPVIVEAVEAVVADWKMPAQPILTYLANTMKRHGRRLPYSTITALNTPAKEPFDALRLPDGTPAPSLQENDILLNEWAAQDLGAQIGDEIELSYYVVGPAEQLLTQSTTFRLKGIVALSGLAADRNLSPEFPGVHDAEDMLSWDPPFPVDLNLIRPKDEDYWDRYRATPKAFVALATGQRLWGSRFGSLTAIRIGVTPEANSEDIHNKLQTGLRESIRPEQMGFVFQPVKQQGLEAAQGATDFGMLFIGFSLFLIIAAALLVGMLFRLGVEQRASEVGLLLSVGYSIRAVRWRLLQEGGLLAGVGCLLGIGGAIFYAWLLMVGLRTWWVDAIGSPFLFLHVNTTSLIIGYLAAMAVILFSIWWTVRQLKKVPAPALLHGVTTWDRATRPKFSRIVALASFILAGALIVLAIVTGATSSPGLFFGSGTLLLIAGLALLSLWFRKLRRRHRQNFGMARIVRLAVDYSGRSPGRSMLSAALVCCACFVIVAVAANRREFGREVLAKNSGTGGFALVAETDIPLHHDLNTEDGRFELGFSDADAEILTAAHVYPMRLLPGEDASCLNLHQPRKPRLLGVAKEQIARGGFHFQAMVDEGAEFKENPWLLLETEIAPVRAFEPGVIPAFGDYNSVLWIMHLGLGKDLMMQNEWGETIRLRFVGLLERSIFQSEVLISEANFLEHFPNASGHAYFLIEAPLEQAGGLSQTLENVLSDYGFDAASTREKLAGFQAVENTYLSIFQTLGGLGLLLGTLGLGIILMRNVIERRGELATLRAFGFRHATLATMLLVENGFLIVIGILIGSLSALIAVAPHLTGGSAQVPWLSLSLTLLLVLLVGLIASALSVTAALRIPLLPALKAE